MKNDQVWRELSLKGKRIFSIAASLMMLTICFQVIATDAKAGNGVSIGPNPSPPNTTYADLPPGTVESYGNASHVTNSSLNPVVDAPYLTNESGNLVYRSSYGTYVINESNPAYLSFISADGTTLVNQSYFTVDTAQGELALTNGTVITADDYLCLIEYDLQSAQNLTWMGRMSLRLDFANNQAPEFTATLLNSTFNDTAWNIVWIVMLNKGSMVSLPLVSKRPIPIASLVNDQIYEPNNNVSMSVNSDSFELNWSGAKSGVLNVIQQASAVSPQYGMKVTFPQKVAAIDPTIVATSTDSNPTNMSSQRKLTYYDGYYWLFYNSGNTGSNAICYQTSGDGLTWSSQMRLPGSTTPAAGSGFDVASRNGMIAVAWLDSAANHNVYFQNGTILGSNILWSNAVTVYSSGALLQPVSVAIGYDSAFWVSYVTTAGNIIVARSYGTTVSFATNLTTTPLDGSTGSNSILFSLLPYANGNIAFVETSNINTGVSAGYVGVRWFYSSYGLWSSLYKYYIGMYGYTGPNYDAKEFSAVASWNGTINILYYGQRNNGTQVGIEYACIYPTTVLHYRGFPSVWYLTEGIDDPTLCMDVNNVLHAFFEVPGVSSNYIEHTQKNDNSDTWSPENTFYYASSGASILGLTSWVNPVGDIALAWAESGSPKHIKFASVPLPFGTPGSPSSSWSRDGLSPYGTYFAMNGISVAPGSGLVVMTQDEVSISGRGGMNLGVSLIYQQPRYYDPINGTSYGYQTFPFCNVGGFWSLDLPWMDGNYTYIGNGQRFVTQWGNAGNANEFVVHGSANFVLRSVTKQGHSFYELITSSGMRYQFNYAYPYKLETISNLENYNPASSTLTQPIDCINLTYTGSSPNYVLSSMTESGMGRSITFTYSGGLLQKITRPDGKYITFTFGVSDSHGTSYLTSVSDVLSRVTHYSYNSTKSYCIENITYPTGGKLALTYSYNNSASTEYKTWLVTSEVIRNGSTAGTPLIRQTNFYYKVVDGQLIFCNVANYNETAKIQGYNEYTFKSAAQDMVVTTKNATGVQMQSQRTWYDAFGQPVSVDNYKGNSTAVNYTTYTAYDDWGNVVYTKDALGHETFSSYANTSTQESFQSEGLLRQTTSGDIFSDSFDNWNYSSWTASLTAGVAALDGTVDPPHAPSVSIKRNDGGVGNAQLTHAFAAQPGGFYIQASFMAKATSIESWIIVTGNGSEKIYLSINPSGFQTYVGTTYTTVAPCAANTWYDVGFYVNQNAGTYNVYINGTLKLSGVSMQKTAHEILNTIRFQAGYSGSGTTTIFFDNVRIYSSLTVSISGLSGYLAQLYDSRGTLLSQSKTGSLTMSALPLNANPCYIILAKIGDTMLTNPTMNVWGGDAYSLIAPSQVSGISKTVIGYTRGLDVISDDSPFPGTYYHGGGDGSTAPWVTDSNAAVSGTQYHVSAYAPEVHYHGFVGGSMSNTGDLIQYIMLQNGEIPQEIELVYSSGSTWSAVYWGGGSSNEDIIGDSNHLGIQLEGYDTYIGAIPQVTGTWLQLIAPSSDLYDPGSITGIYYALYGGTAKWDFSAVNTAGIVINNLPSGGLVKMVISGGATISQSVMGGSVTFNPYPNGGVFPITATFQIWIGNTLIYASPVISEIYNGDWFTYSASSFYPNIIKSDIHDRQVGSMTYQDYANTTKMQSYISYNFEGNPVEAKSSLGTGWAYSRAGYDIYGNLLWSYDPTGRMTSYQYTSADKNTYPTTTTTGGMIDNFDWDRSWVLSYSPSNMSWITAQYSAAQVYSTGCSINLGISNALPPYTSNKTMSKDYKTNKISKLSLNMYVTSFSNRGGSTDTLDSGIRLRLYDSNGVNYATYTYWLACWKGSTYNRTTTDPNIKVVHGAPGNNTWLNQVLYPSNDWSIDWSRCDKVKLELFINVTNANANDVFNVYYDDLVHWDSADTTQHTENFEGANNWIPNQSPTRAWMLNQNSTTQSHSATHSEQNSVSGAPGDGTDYGTGMMYKVLSVKSVSTVSLWMYCDQYSHDGSTWDTMNTGVMLKLYDSGGNNYANYTYWLACWYQGTNNKSASDSFTKVIFGKPTMSTWINVKLNPSSDWNINWSLCNQVKVELFTSCSGASADTFRIYFDDLSLSSNFSSTSYQYDTNNGRVLSITDVAGHKTSYQYDALGRLIRTNNTDGSYSNCTYDDTHNKVISYDALRLKTTSYYDGIGRLIITVRYGTGASSYSSVNDYYNWLDEAVRVVQYPEGTSTWTTYDYLGRTLTVKNNDTSVSSYTYNDLASTVTFADELGHKTVWVYDNLGRLNATREYNSPSQYNQTLMTYNAVGELLTVRAANGNVTSMSYDSLGRLITTTYPDIKSGSTKYSESTTYDLAGRVLNETARNGSVTQSLYDASGRLIRTIGNSDTIRTYYDADGNIIQETNSLGSVNYYYDFSNRLVRMIEKIGTTSYWLNYTYDVDGNLLTTTYPGNVKISDSYDSYARLSAVKCGSTNLIQYTYNHDDTVATEKFNNGNSTITYTYNNRDWVSRIMAKSSGGADFLDLNYSYSTNGNVVAIKSGNSAVGNEYYTYDYLNRLTNAMANTTFHTISYTYDAMGNRQVMNDGTAHTYHYGAYNKLSNDSSYTYTYYANGEVSNKNTVYTNLNRWNYTYNSFDQLTQVKKSTYSGGWGAYNSVAQYYYDANGARAKVVEGSTTTQLVYVGTDPLYDISTGGKGNCSIYVGGNLVMRYVSSSISYAYISDAIGSTRFVLKNGVKDSNPVFSAITYKPFGGPFKTSGSNNYTYTGEKNDTSTGLEYLGARYYDPSTGRFISMDPLLGRLSSPQTMDRFAYCLNSPLLHTDPTGMGVPATMNYHQGQKLDPLGNLVTACNEMATYVTEHPVVIVIAVIVVVATIATLESGGWGGIVAGELLDEDLPAADEAAPAIEMGSGVDVGEVVNTLGGGAERNMADYSEFVTPGMTKGGADDITAMLNVYNRQIVSIVDAAGDYDTPLMRGTQIHHLWWDEFQGSVDIGELRDLFYGTKPGGFGPDFILKDNGPAWWDVTTETNWDTYCHQNLYQMRVYGPGFGVLY